LLAYWADHPPVHVLLAAFMGVKPQGSADAGYRPVTMADVAELRRGGANIPVQNIPLHRGLRGPGVIDFEELKQQALARRRANPTATG
jgi:hypothetical protein